MKEELFFMPLGGAQKVGASCYYLKLGNANILLDAGIGIKDNLIFEPNLYSLKTSPFIESLSQINQVFISHAHTDHIGYLLKLMKDANKASVYMTKITELLTKYQLYDKNFLMNQKKTEESRLAAQSILDNIINVTYMKPINFKNCKITFFPAGHIPGAMMMLFEIGKRKILYTGDYSITNTPLTKGCFIPENYGIDTIIMCGLHAKHPDYIRKSNNLYKTINYIYKSIQIGKSILCEISQLSKGIEFIKALTDSNQTHVPIYIDTSMLPIIEKMEQLSIPILNIDTHIKNDTRPTKPHIYITSNNKNYDSQQYESIKVDFSLHEDFSEMETFIKRINPKHVFLVHCSKSNSKQDYTIEQKIMYDSECRTQFTFAEENTIYKL